MRGAVFLALVFVASAVAGGELFHGFGWGPLPPVTGQVKFGSEFQWVLTPGESVDGGWLRSFDLLGYAERIDIGINDGQGGFVLLDSVTPSGPTDVEGWTHYDVLGKDFLSTNGTPFTFGGHASGPLYGLHDGYFKTVQGFDIPNSPNNALIMPAGTNAGAGVPMRFTWETLDPPYGDANHDGRIDLNDFGMVKARFQRHTPAPFEGGDLTGNQYVDLNDFALVKQNFGWRAAAVTVPESSAWTLACAGLAVLLSAHGARIPWPRRRTFCGQTDIFLAPPLNERLISRTFGGSPTSVFPIA